MSRSLTHSYFRVCRYRGISVDLRGPIDLISRAKCGYSAISNNRRDNNNDDGQGSNGYNDDRDDRDDDSNDSDATATITTASPLIFISPSPLAFTSRSPLAPLPPIPLWPMTRAPLLPHASTLSLSLVVTHPQKSSGSNSGSSFTSVRSCEQATTASPRGIFFTIADADARTYHGASLRVAFFTAGANSKSLFSTARQNPTSR
ncbi:hypothetical protein BOTBODRAFT_176711 [Botryobasidium botryosum FD-172 SS1]|uniref:Uncharacterized protein n=1 Tax=Botryobasidium botryosum (strain FD-172 SS1) TaxID=930990 RepID=A0A067M9D1_BOTB1|nr:hypothetical protein BOTBODRAFT_176711 [Botryobasidium botryosum FD-172 SS1]